MPESVYAARHASHSLWVPLRGLQYHVRCWGPPLPDRPQGPTPEPSAAPSAAPQDTARPAVLVLLHGWMDVSASYQFLVDELLDAGPRTVLAPDWRGFGLTANPGADGYWFPDYLADLELMLDALLPPGSRVDLVGHSMGGNVAMAWAGLRPERIRRLVNLEGFGMPRTQAEQAPARLAQWIDQLKSPATLRPYDSLDAVVQRLMANNPLLPADKARWLAPHWAAQRSDGQWELRSDPAHKHVNPVLHQVEEALVLWRRIQAPVLWVDGDLTDMSRWWGQRYPRAEFEQRLDQVRQVTRVRLSPSGHMLHHDQPERLAQHLLAFLHA